MQAKTYFEKMNKAELVDAAEAFGEDSDGTKDQLVTRLVTAGVTPQEHAEMFQLDAPVAEENETTVAEDVTVEDETDSAPVEETEDSGGEEEDSTDEDVEIVTQEATPKKQEKYLIKMERNNPMFEVRGHRFTKKNPFALVSPQTGEWILKNISGFRMAYPSEIEEFYN